MPTRERREDHIIELFVSAYDNGAWKHAALTFPDKHNDSGIDGLAKRADGAVLAIEHTVIEPFVGDIADQSEMLPVFPLIESDKSLLVPGAWIQVFVPVGTLHLQKPSVREAIAAAVHSWLRTNHTSLPRGASQGVCRVQGKPEFDITLNLKVTDIPGGGALHVRRQQTSDTLGEVIEKMLTKKLPKLADVASSTRVLLLERRHMNLYPRRILDEIEKRRPAFPALADVHEIWIAEKIEFFQANDGDVRFERFVDGRVVQSFAFQDDILQHQNF